MALEAEPAGYPPADELAAAHSEAEPAAGELARSAVAEPADAEQARSAVAAQVRCVAAADDSFPDEAAEADSAVDDSSQAEVVDGCSAAHCSDDRCAPVVLTGGSCRDGYLGPADSAQADSAVPQADHCVAAARTRDCSQADYWEPADWEPAGSAAGDSPDWAGSARAGSAAADSVASGCWVG